MAALRSAGQLRRLWHHCAGAYRGAGAEAGTKTVPFRLIRPGAGLFWLGGGGGRTVDLFFSAAWLVIVTWLILRAVNQRGLLPHLPPASPLADVRASHVTVIVPARDEAANIGRCLHSLLAQDYPAERLHVIVVDDHSADDTAAIVSSVAAGHFRVSLLSCPPLPPRWTGKSHACWIGARAAPIESEWLCFIDADVWGEGALISSTVRAALGRKLDLLSVAPRQHLQSFAERLVLPCGLILLSFIQDLRREQARTGSGVTATGQFMLIRREAYEAAGGHAAVSSAICEDLEFARRLKQSGRSVLLMGGEDLLTTRMYTSWRTLWPGLAKNLIDTLGGRRATLTVALIAVLLAWSAVVIPVIDAAACAQGTPSAWAALSVALLASSAAFALHIVAARYFRIPFYYGFLFPLGYTVGALMALDSVRRRLRGRVSWKGRIYS
jgi:chlorobactene glucosyltransferase